MDLKSMKPRKVHVASVAIAGPAIVGQRAIGAPKDSSWNMEDKKTELIGKASMPKKERPTPLILQEGIDGADLAATPTIRVEIPIDVLQQVSIFTHAEMSLESGPYEIYQVIWQFLNNRVCVLSHSEIFLSVTKLTYNILFLFAYGFCSPQLTFRIFT